MEVLPFMTMSVISPCVELSDSLTVGSSRNFAFQAMNHGSIIENQMVPTLGGPSLLSSSVHHEIDFCHSEV